MNSNKINKNFTISDNLTREDITTYRETIDEKVKQLIEAKSLESDFESDALEGWRYSLNGIDSMQSIDAKFKSKRSNLKMKLISTFFIMSLIFTSYFLIKSNSSKIKKSTPIKTQNSIIYEKTDILTSDEIESMKELPIKEQIKISTIQKDFTIQKEETTTPTEEKENIEVERIEYSKINQQINNEVKAESEIVKNQSFGKEMYLASLKLVDYRIYRSRPAIKTKTIELNNTPASQEDKFSKEEDVSNWKVTEIPYIDYIEKTMSLFAKGNYKKTLSRLELILESYPTDINALFYSGLCYFNLDESEKAIHSFEAALNSEFNNFNEEAEWYLAKSYIANNQNEKASLLFKKISQNGGYYSKQALKYLN